LPRLCMASCSESCIAPSTPWTNAQTSMHTSYTNRQKISKMSVQMHKIACKCTNTYKPRPRGARPGKRIKASTTQGWGDARTPEPEVPALTLGLDVVPVRGAQVLGRVDERPAAHHPASLRLIKLHSLVLKVKSCTLPGPRTCRINFYSRDILTVPVSY